MRNLAPSVFATLPSALRCLPPRQPPRDGRGRFLPATWLQAAETYSAADLAWFRSPIA